LRKFGSVQSIEQQTLEALAQEIAPRLARRVYEHFHPDRN